MNLRVMAEVISFFCVSWKIVALVSVSVLACSCWSLSGVLGQRLCSARIRSCRCYEGFGTIWAVIRCFSRGHCIACTSDGCWGSISCTVPLLPCRLNLRLLRSRCNNCAPVEHGWSGARTACAFGCGGMLRAFVQYPPTTSDAKVLTCWGGTTHYGCCLSLCRGYWLLLLCLRRGAVAANFMSLHIIPVMCLVAKDTPASMVFVA
jgi:hypothetical protein